MANYARSSRYRRLHATIVSLSHLCYTASANARVSFYRAFGDSKDLDVHIEIRGNVKDIGVAHRLLDEGLSISRNGRELLVAKLECYMCFV